MPRELLRRRYFQRFKERQRRLGPGVRAASWVSTRKPQFIDYYPDLPGTIPEKIVFQELVRRQINFYFSMYFGDMRLTFDKIEHWRPDFYLPDYNVVIEVFGTYWHTREGMYEHDLVKAIVYTATGYKFYVLTDEEVIANVRTAIEKIPEIATAAIHGNMHVAGNRPFDPTAAIRARMRRWPRVVTERYRQRRRIQIKGISYPVPRRPARPRPERGPMFTEVTQEVMDAADWLIEAYEWHLEMLRRTAYRDWLKQQGYPFRKYPPWV